MSFLGKAHAGAWWHELGGHFIVGTDTSRQISSLALQSSLNNYEYTLVDENVEGHDNKTSLNVRSTGCCGMIRIFEQVHTNRKNIPNQLIVLTPFSQVFISF